MRIISKMGTVGILVCVFFSMIPVNHVCVEATDYDVDVDDWNYTNEDTTDDGGQIVKNDDDSEATYNNKDTIYKMNIPFIEISTVQQEDGFNTYELGADITETTESQTDGEGYWTTYREWEEADLIGTVDITVWQEFTTYSDGRFTMIIGIDADPNTYLYWRIHTYIDFDVDGSDSDTSKAYNIINYDSTYDDIKSEMAFGDEGSRYGYNDRDKIRQEDSSGEYIRVAAYPYNDATWKYSINNNDFADGLNQMWYNKEEGTYNEDMRLQILLQKYTSQDKYFEIRGECESY